MPTSKPVISLVVLSLLQWNVNGGLVPLMFNKIWPVPDWQIGSAIPVIVTAYRDSTETL